jgi:hypothetical protein
MDEHSEALILEPIETLRPIRRNRLRQQRSGTENQTKETA